MPPVDQKPIARLDFRTKLILLLLIASLGLSGSLVGQPPVVRNVFGAAPFLFLLIARRLGGVFKGALLFAFALGLNVLARHVDALWISGVASIMSYVLLSMLPGIVMGYYVFVTTTMSEMAASLSRWHAPQSILIPLTLVKRFFFSVHHDSQRVRQAMRLQGLGGHRLLTHPIESFSHFVVPLLTLAVKTADEVTISAQTRGLVPGQPRTSLTVSRLTWCDGLALVVATAFCVWLFL